MKKHCIYCDRDIEVKSREEGHFGSCSQFKKEVVPETVHVTDAQKQRILDIANGLHERLNKTNKEVDQLILDLEKFLLMNFTKEELEK